MTTDPGEDICDALVAFLKDPTRAFSIEPTVSKPEDPNEELDKIVDVTRILFWTHGEEEEKIGRNGQAVERHHVAMAIVRKRNTEFTKARLAGFAREVKDAVRGQRMAGWVYSGKEATKADLERIHKGQYLEVVIFTYSGTTRLNA